MAEIDIEKLVAEATRKREAALAASEAAKAEAKTTGVKTDKANQITRSANQKFEQAKGLTESIGDYEFTINFMVGKISKGDKLSVLEQQELNNAVKSYNAVTARYQKLIGEGNKLLLTIPKDSKAKVEVLKPQEVAPTIGEPKQPEEPGSAGVTVEQQNASIDQQLESARTTLVKMQPKDRIALAQALTSAGYEVPAIGEYNEGLLLTYQAALQAAKNYNTTNKYVIKTGVLPSVDFTGFLTKQTTIQNQIKGLSGAGGKGAAGPEISQRISDPTQAASQIGTVFSTLLKRDATPQEVSALTKILNDFEKKNPFSTQDGKTTGGLDRTQFLTDLIKSGTYSNNPKSFPKILGKLSEEVATRKAGEEEGKNLDSSQLIAETARLNGVTVTPEQMLGYLADIKAGKQVGAIQQNIRNIAATGYPDNIKKLIAEGNDLLTVYSPYRKAMATELELNENTIGLEDPSLQAAIGPDKEMTLFEYKKALRKDNRWQYTENARQEASSLVSTVLKDFGFMG
jgi:hypothetical protein